MPKLRFNYYTKLSWTPVANEVRDIQGTVWELCNNLSKLFIRKYSGFVAEEYCKVLEEFSPLPFLKETSYGRTSCPKNDESDLYYEEIMNKYRQFYFLNFPEGTILAHMMNGCHYSPDNSSFVCTSP